MMKKLANLAFFAALALSSGMAREALAQNATSNDCGFSLSVNDVNLVWSGTLGTQQITFTVNKSKNKACTYAVTFSKGGATDYNRRMSSGTATLSYQLYGESSLTNILKDVPEATTVSDVLTGSFGTGTNQSATRTYFIQIPYSLATTPTLKPAGTYTNTYMLSVYNITNLSSPSAAGAPDQTANVTLTTVVPRNVQLSLVPSGSAFDPNATTQVLDFGTLTEGASRGFDLRVLTNAGYQVTFSSQNNGVLKHASSAISSVVPYTLSVNSATKSLVSSATSPVIVASGSGQTSTQGAANAVAVTIGNVADKVAGNYSDIITVTAATTE